MSSQSTFVIVHPDGSRSYRRSSRARQMAEVFGTSPLHRANEEALEQFTEQDEARARLRRVLSDPNMVVVRRGTGLIAYLDDAPQQYTVVSDVQPTADLFEDLVRAVRLELDSMSDLPEVFAKRTDLDNTIDRWRASNWTSSENTLAIRQAIWAADGPGYICTSAVAVLDPAHDCGDTP